MAVSHSGVFAYDLCTYTFTRCGISAVGASFFKNVHGVGSVPRASLSLCTRAFHCGLGTVRSMLQAFRVSAIKTVDRDPCNTDLPAGKTYHRETTEPWIQQTLNTPQSLCLVLSDHAGLNVTISWSEGLNFTFLNVWCDAASSSIWN